MKKVEKYMELLKELKTLGEQIMEEFEWEDDVEIPEGQYDEICCMDEHLDCCMRIMEREGKRK